MMRLGRFTKLGVLAAVIGWTVVLLASTMAAARGKVVLLPPTWVLSVLFPFVGLPVGEASDLSERGLLVMALGMLLHWPVIGWLLDLLVAIAHGRSGRQSRGDGSPEDQVVLGPKTIELIKVLRPMVVACDELGDEYLAFRELGASLHLAVNELTRGHFGGVLRVLHFPSGMGAPYEGLFGGKRSDDARVMKLRERMSVAFELANAIRREVEREPSRGG